MDRRRLTRTQNLRATPADPLPPSRKPESRLRDRLPQASDRSFLAGSELLPVALTETGWATASPRPESGGDGDQAAWTSGRDGPLGGRPILTSPCPLVSGRFSESKGWGLSTTIPEPEFLPPHDIAHAGYEAWRDFAKL